MIQGLAFASSAAAKSPIGRQQGGLDATKTVLYLGYPVTLTLRIA